MANLLESLRFIFQNLRWNDFVDIFLVWVVIYRILILIKKSGAVQILSGLGIMAFAYMLSIRWEFITFNWILEKFFANLFIIVVILFQAEIRRALAQIGSTPFFSSISSAHEGHIIEELAKGAVGMAQKGFGALIVIEREIALDYFIEVGVELDASVNSDMISAIFHSSSPLHDGAVIIRNGRIHSARCFLPLSKNPILDKNLGTRHRAAIGLTEETDAVVMVVSEESRSVGLVIGGQLTPDLDHNSVRQGLYAVYGLKYRADRGAE